MQITLVYESLCLNYKYSQRSKLVLLKLLSIAEMQRREKIKKHREKRNRASNDDRHAHM